MNQIDVSVSFDTAHDAELYELLVAESQEPGSGFAVSSCSERFSAEDVWSARVRRRVGRADQVIIICGEHTDEAIGVCNELRIVQEENKPYFLLWGRRDSMCTKPVGAKNADGMYSWTSEFVQEQIAQTSRTTHREMLARAMKRPARPERSDTALPGAADGTGKQPSAAKR
jgi:hypothetical protein